MKKLFTLFSAVLFTLTTFAQAPEKMSYQAVIRDAGNALVSNQAVGMQISVLQTTANGTAVYVETQTPTTNTNGLVSLEIGTGNVVSGDFAAIDWSAGPYFIKTETDPTGGTSYSITGTCQMLSVPYALHAKTATTFPGGIDQAYIEALEARLTALEPQPAAIGDLRAGGVVFWVDPTDNTHGLVCSLSVFSPSIDNRLTWLNDDSVVIDIPGLPNVTSSPPNGPGAEIGDGMANTTRILAYDPTAPAALAARSLGPEWYLPSIKELNEINLNLSTLLSVPGFSVDNFYWSSTEHSGSQAWSTNPFIIFQVNFKDSNLSVRAVRAF